MDDLSLTQIVQASTLNKYSSDGYDMEAERGICIYSEQYFKHTSTSFLQGLRYPPTENISDWIKRKQSYKPAIAIPKTFEELLEEKIIFDCNFLFALDPVNINKEVNMLHRSAHIFCETIRDKIDNVMKKLFYNDKAMRVHMFNKKSPEQTKNEIGLSDALGLIFSVCKEIRELATHYGSNDQTQFDSIQKYFCRKSEKNKTDLNVRKAVTLAKYENLIA